MDQIKFFESVVEPSIERIGLYGISHAVNFDGRHFVVTHKISKNVMTEFDTRLSRYLAAVTGSGLPGATVETRIRDVATGHSWNPYPPRHLPAGPNAMATAVQLALGSEQIINVRHGAWMSDETSLDREMELTTETAMALEQTVAICAQVGPMEFLDISGDMERVIARPLGGALDMMVMDVSRGTISIPSTTESGAPPYQGALFGFDKEARQAPTVNTYLARARHEIALAKEDAIYAFREAAEVRIIEFDSALAGRELSGHRLDNAQSLVSRLQAGLGDTLLGLSEAAQVTALDWAAEVRSLPNRNAIEGEDPTTPSRPRLVR